MVRAEELFKVCSVTFHGWVAQDSAGPPSPNKPHLRTTLTYKLPQTLEWFEHLGRDNTIGTQSGQATLQAGVK